MKTACKLLFAAMTAAVILHTAHAEDTFGSSAQANLPSMADFKMSSADFKMIQAAHWSITGDNLVVKGNVFIPTEHYDLYADHVVINLKNRDFDARGNLRLHQKSTKTKTVKPGDLAQFEDVNGITYEVSAVSTDVYGQQTVTVKYHQIVASVTASEISGNLRTGYFRFSDARIATFDLTIKVKSGRRLSNGIIELEDATISTCTYMESDNAHYAVSCGKAEIRPYNTDLAGFERIQKDYNEYSLTATNCLVRVYGVPLLWLPYIYKPKTETLGLFQIQYGRSGDYGNYISISKKYQLLDYPYATVRLRGDWMEKRGFGAGLVGTVRAENSRTDYSFFNLYDRNPELSQDDAKDYGIHIPHYRYDFRISNVTHITPELDFRGHFEYMSDEFFNEDFSAYYYGGDPRPVTFAALERQFDNFTASIYFRPQVNRFFNTVEQLPTARLDIPRQEILDTNLYFQSENSLGYFKRKWRTFNDLPGYDRPYDYASARMDTVNFLYYPLQLDFLTIVPRAGIRMTAYSNSSKTKIRDEELYNIITSNDPDYGVPHNVPRDYDNRGGSRVRFVGEVGVQANTKISRVWQDVRSYWLDIDGLRHVMIPYVNYTFIPRPTVSRKYLYYFDDIDRIEEQNFFRLGLINRLQTRQGDKLVNYLVMENFWDLHLNRKDGYSNIGDFCTRLTMKPLRGLTISTFFAISPNENRLPELRRVTRNQHDAGYPGLNMDCLSRLSFSVNYVPIEDVSLNFSYEYQNPYRTRGAYSMGSTLTELESGRAFDQIYTDIIQQLTLGIQVPITPDRRTFAAYTMSYDFCDGFAPSHKITLLRQFHCWEVAVSYVYTTEYDDNEKTHDSSFQINARLLRLEGPLSRPSGGMIATGQAFQ